MGLRYSHLCSYMDCLFFVGSDVALIIGQTRATAENKILTKNPVYVLIFSQQWKK